MLEAFGPQYKVSIASTALEARTLMNIYRYKLVIVTNFGMPPEHAVSVVPDEHTYPVIFISGVFDEELRAACRTKRLRCMVAPFSLEQLREALRSALSDG
jgi:DNA-binding NtrC family response regulator